MTNDDFHKEITHPTSEVSVEKDQIPDQIGEYKIDCLLDKGGMSLLFLGTNPETYEAYAIKVLSPKYLGNEEVVQRFMSEAKIIALADHPNIVKLYDSGIWEGGFYIAMEYIPGISLRQYLLKRPLSLKKALEFILEIAYALCHLHTHGVIHRDLKLENILVTETGDIKVIDFGIAQMLKEKADEKKPHIQRLIGTPSYMSPEQRENPENVSYPSDVYSLGIISYELILGKLSFGQLHLGLIPKGLQKILAKALQPKPQDRYQDVVDFITDLSSYLNSDEFRKDERHEDASFETIENLASELIRLSPTSTPQFEDIELGFAYHKGIGLTPLYVDFFQLNENAFSILLVEPFKKGVAGIIHTAEFRGMLRAKVHGVKDPIALMKELNDLLIKDGKEEVFTLTYLVIKPHQNHFKSISCGFGNLWHIKGDKKNIEKIPSENAALGIDQNPHFIEYSGTTQTGDTLILSSFTSLSLKDIPTNELTQEHFKEALSLYSHLPSQKLLDAVLRRSKSLAFKAFDEQSIAMIAVKLL